MLDEMDAGQIAEWQAFDRLQAAAQAEADRRAELAARAEAGVRNHKRGAR